MRYYIATRNHESLWPRGVILWWAAGQRGYSSTLENAGMYEEKEAREICKPGRLNFMVPCELASNLAVRVVDIDLLRGWEDKGVAL